MGFFKKNGEFTPDEPGEKYLYQNDKEYIIIAQSRDIALIKEPERFGVYHYPFNCNEDRHEDKQQYKEIPLIKNLKKESSAWDFFREKIQKHNDEYATLDSNGGTILLVKSPKNQYAIYQDEGSDTKKFISGEYGDEDKARRIFCRIAEAKSPEDAAKRVYDEACKKFTIIEGIYLQVKSRLDKEHLNEANRLFLKALKEL